MKHKSLQTRRIGLIKIASAKISKEHSEGSSEEFMLWRRVQAARKKGDIEEAVRRIDVLIRYVEKEGMPPFEYQVDKMLMTNPGNFAQLIPIYEKQLDYYTEKKNVFGQIDSLVSLTAVSVNSGQPLQVRQYLAQAEELIKSIPDEQKELERRSSMSGVSRLDGKIEQIRQAKRYIEEIMK